VNHHAFLSRIAQIIYDKKGMNILALDVQGVSSITDYLIIAEGLADRHVTSIARAIIDEIEKNKGPMLRHAEGVKTGDWAVLDYGFVMIHLFRPGVRHKYAIERLWSKGEIVDLLIEVAPS
jgi:ribosome-associated protein